MICISIYIYTCVYIYIYIYIYIVCFGDPRNAISTARLSMPLALSAGWVQAGRLREEICEVCAEQTHGFSWVSPIYLYVCMYVCMYVRTYVRTYVCMYVYIYTNIHTICIYIYDIYIYIFVKPGAHECSLQFNDPLVLMSPKPIVVNRWVRICFNGFKSAANVGTQFYKHHNQKQKEQHLNATNKINISSTPDLCILSGTQICIVLYRRLYLSLTLDSDPFSN